MMPVIQLTCIIAIKSCVAFYKMQVFMCCIVCCVAETWHHVRRLWAVCIFISLTSLLAAVSHWHIHLLFLWRCSRKFTGCIWLSLRDQLDESCQLILTWMIRGGQVIHVFGRASSLLSQHSVTVQTQTELGFLSTAPVEDTVYLILGPWFGSQLSAVLCHW